MSDHTRNIANTQNRIKTLLQAEPVASYRLGKNDEFALQRYVCSEVKGVVPPFDALVIGIQFSGARIKTASAQGVVGYSSTSVVTVFPTDTETSFYMLGDVDFALFIIDPNGSELALKLYNMARCIVSVVMLSDPVLDALIRQLLLSVAGKDAPEHQYIEAITKVLMLHTERLLSNQKQHNFKSNSLQLNRVRTSIEHIHQHLNEDLSVSQLAQHISVSESYFRKIFAQVTGHTVHQFILQSRLNRARELLIHSSLSIGQIAESLAFSSQSHLTTQFAKRYQLTPGQYRKRMSA